VQVPYNCWQHWLLFRVLFVAHEPEQQSELWEQEELISLQHTLFGHIPEQQSEVCVQALFIFAQQTPSELQVFPWQHNCELLHSQFTPWQQLPFTQLREKQSLSLIQLPPVGFAHNPFVQTISTDPSGQQSEFKMQGPEPGERQHLLLIH